ncbi:acylneuraminate cytidylyltransferase family protein [Gammaproteobacteria bacterium]|nr:acylneuraminate cytidylyltransferase family protein [Gammaproteobacteria bacterium]
MKGYKTLGIVTARSGSKGLKNKNILPFQGEPLLTWPIKCLLGAKNVDKVILSTDSEVYKNIGISAGASVPFIRPEKYSNDKASTFSTIEHAISFMKKEFNEEYDYIALLEPTSPLTESSDVDEAIIILHESREFAHSIVGVGEVVDQHPDFCVKFSNDNLIMPYNDSFKVSRRQDIEKIYHYDGSLYISKVDKLIQYQTFYHDFTLAKLMPKKKNIEIDTIEDFIIAEALFKL